MKKYFFCIALIAFLTVSAQAQSKKADPNDIPEPSPAASAADSDKDSGTELLKAGSNLEAQLQSTLDVRKSKVGDPVIFKTTKTIKEDGTVIVPKGTRLIGRVTEVQQKSNANQASMIGIVFDSIQGKGLTAPISASIISVTGVSKSLVVDDLFTTSSTGSASSSANASSGRGGGLLGGGTILNDTSGAAAGVLSTTTQVAGGAVNAAGTAIGGAAAPGTGPLTGIRIDQTTGVSAASSSTISSPDRKLRIEKGSNFQLRLNNSVAN